MLIALGVVAVIVVALVIIMTMAASKPDTFRVERTATIKADPGKVFSHINDFHNWAAWSPFEKLDPNMQTTFTGAPSGKGAVYEWKGNNKAGAGRMEILESTAASKIVIKLDFISPFEAHNIAEFTFAPQGGSTNVTWLMHGPAPLMSKVMQVFMNMDDMIGKDFATGLARLKRVAEG